MNSVSLSFREDFEYFWLFTDCKFKVFEGNFNCIFWKIGRFYYIFGVWVLLVYEFFYIAGKFNILWDKDLKRSKFSIKDYIRVSFVIQIGFVG